MNSINTARDFFINQQGLSPDQADMIIGQGLQAYNEQTQPKSMMQMASGGIARLGYQMGGSPIGIQTMPMDTGAPLQVPQQPQPNFSSAQNITMNPLLNYGQTQLANGGGTPLTMRGGGIARLGYEMGGDVGMSQMGSEETIQMDQQQALQTIIQILIENGIPPEQAQQLAQQILQIFMQGGAPAVEQFANQLEQQEAQAMASGGIAGYGYRQGYGWGSIVKGVLGGAASAVKGVANAVKSVAKSPIGKIALTVAATYALGPAGLGIGQSMAATPWIASAINAGLANALVQGVTTGKFNPMQALTAAALGGIGGAMGAPGTTATPNAGDAMYTNYSDALSQQYANAGLQNTTTTPLVDNSALRSITTNPLTDTGGESAYTNYGDRLSRVNETISNRIGDTISDATTGIQNLYKDPLGTIKNLGTGAMDLIEKNPKTAAAIAFGTGLGTGIAVGAPQQEGESDDAFAKRQQEEANLSLTQLGRNLKITNPYFYQRYGAVNPFATTAANGGIMGYARGGSMVPPARQIEGGVIELDARKSGGYIPYGKKERVDDVPAMLAKDEFVFTSRAVKGAGGGDARQGAKKMYALMKQLEAKGARA